MQALTFNINGKDVTLSINAWDTLANVLRRSLALTGTKKGCEEGSAELAQSFWRASL